MKENFAAGMKRSAIHDMQANIPKLIERANFKRPPENVSVREHIPSIIPD
jgi:hypothetical protein